MYKKLTKEELDKTLKEHTKWLENPSAGKKADLSGADLRCVDLSNVDLRFADLSNADLGNANLRYAKLTGANLSGADLRCVDLSNADLTLADLSCAYLSGADLRFANLSGVELTCAKLSGACLFEADLSRANLRYADLIAAELLSADLLNVNLRKNDINKGTYNNIIKQKKFDYILRFANLSGVELTCAKLSGACLFEADLLNVNLRKNDINKGTYNNIIKQKKFDYIINNVVSPFVLTTVIFTNVFAILATIAMLKIN